MKTPHPFIQNAISQLDWEQILIDAGLRSGDQAEAEVAKMKESLIFACEQTMKIGFSYLRQPFFEIHWDPKNPENSDALKINYSADGFEEEKEITIEQKIADLEKKKMHYLLTDNYEMAALLRDDIEELKKQLLTDDSE
jgi:hypothetical protein